jgi:signal transduction histidine kinase
MYRWSGLFQAGQTRPALIQALASLAPLRRRGLRRRLSAILIAATLGPVIAVSVVAVALIFSSVEQGIQFETVRGLQVARSLFLQEVQEVSARAGKIGDDAALLRAMALEPSEVSARLAELSRGSAAALFEVTNSIGDVMARCAQGTCDDLLSLRAPGALEPTDRSPVILRALAYERTVSIESAGDRLVVRAALPLADPALRLLGALVVSVPVDGLVVDRLKATLGAGRDVIIYRGVEPSTSTFVAATGARLAGPKVPPEVLTKNLSSVTPVMPLDVAGHSYSVAFGQLQDVNAQRVGLLGVAVDREPLAAARRRASTTLVSGALLALALAIALANLLARRLTRPLQNLHAGALSIARGDLDTKITVDSEDEIGDVAQAFRVMTRSLKENQEGLAARVRELVTVHQVGRAVSSVVDLDQVLRSVVGEALTVLNGKTAAIALLIDSPAAAQGTPRAVDRVDEARLAERSPSREGRGTLSGFPADRVDEARLAERSPSREGRGTFSGFPADRARGKFAVRAVAGEPVGRRLAPMAEAVAMLGWPRRTSAVEADPQLMAAAAASGLLGPMIAAPLSLKERMVGVILVGRLGEARFEEADLRLLVTFADQTATAIENARLYSEVRAFSENLELKVRERTAELEHAKGEIEHALRELGAAQGALIHSERMAALGMLVAGIAHEVNSPAAAVQGLVDALQDTVRRLGQCAHELYTSSLPPESVHRYFAFVDGLLPEMASAPLSSSLDARQRSRRLKTELAGLPGADVAAAMLAEVGQLGERSAGELRLIAGGKSLAPLAGYLREVAFLARSAGTIRTAIGSIRRIVGALKRYSRLDEAPLERVDVHAGIEDTLVILSHQLKSDSNGVNVKRSYSKLPPITAYVGELNQVWTNLIHNAVQATGGRGEILIETKVENGDVQVAIQDAGPGIPANVLPRIFEPFFTTKEKGEGTGLGLSISHRIVEKHGGTIRVNSEPGRTRFEVRIPIEGPLQGRDPSSPARPVVERIT